MKRVNLDTQQISVIICTYNREKYLPIALNSLKEQSLDKNKFEIIIVNNNSTDNTETVCNEFIKQNPELNIKYFLETQRGLSAARNRGIKESSGTIVIFIDDDAELTKNYLQEAINFFNEFPEVDAMGGKIIPKYEDNKEPEWMSLFLWGLVTKSDWGDKIRKYPYSKYPPGCSMAFRKSVFNETGLFDTELYSRCDDKYIFLQLDKNKKKYLYNPKFILYHHIDKSRLNPESLKRIALLVGSSERVRLRNAKKIRKILKILEYIIKLFIGIIVGIYFILTKKSKKGIYLIKNRWFTLQGYFNKDLR
ncbi:glycosyltransferase [Melioribacter sp. Ez-97]|uniref:glycosyltransferase n=1 Tax=Melioribacter sp. Ez-97 TaxID=3423434 RepID=UPI003EDB3C3C